MKELKHRWTNISGKLLHKEDGAAAVVVALMLVVLMGFGALAVDVGSLYKARREMVTAADAAALAGARQLALTEGVDTPGAIAVAENYATVMNEAETVAVNIINIGTEQAIEVVATRNERMYLARALGFMNNNVSARAVAKWGYPTEMTGGNVLPLFMTYNQFNDGVDELHLKFADYGGNWGLLDVGSGASDIATALQGYPVILSEAFTVGETIKGLSEPGSASTIINAIESNAPKPEKDGRMVRAAEGLVGMVGWIPIVDIAITESGGKLDLTVLGFAAYEIIDVITDNQGRGSANALVDGVPRGTPYDYGDEASYPRGMIIGRFVTGQMTDADISSLSQDQTYNYGMFKVKLVE
jgi:Flp pilus assembly protein TadG